MFSPSPVKLCIGGLRQTAESLVTYKFHVLNYYGIKFCPGVSISSQKRTLNSPAVFCTRIIQDVSGGTLNILGGGSMDYSE